MNWRYYWNTLLLARVSFLAWAGTMAVWALLIVYIYPSVREFQGMEQYFMAMPEQVRAAIGASSPEALSLIFSEGSLDFRAFLNTEYMSWWSVMIGIYAVVYCGGLASREVERGTMDLLLAQPLRRSAFLLTKFGAFVSLVVGLGVASFVVVAISLLFLGDANVNLAYLAAAHLVGVLLVLAVAGFSVLASCLLLDPRKSLALAGVATALNYFLDILAPSLDAVEWLQKGSLFYYYDSLMLLFKGDVNWAGVGVYGGVALGSLVAALVVFQRKDIVT